jgi:hypothetical protein
MPDLVMHHYFGKSVYHKLPDEIKVKIDNIKLYDFATAGPDPFFFVSFWNGKKNKESLNFGNFMHKNKTRDFFIKLIDVSKKDEKMFSYLCGFIAHYALDLKAHPYVFYHTGVYNKDDITTLQYRGLHTVLERGMDTYIIKKHYYKNPNRFKIYKHVLTLKKLDESLKPSVNEVFKKVFNKSDGFEHVNKSIKDQRKFYKFIYDPFGIKNKLLAKLDNNKSSLDLKTLSYYGKEIKDVDIFNLNKNKWTNPADVTITSSESFFELFDSALEDCIKMIKVAYEVVFEIKEINLNNYFLNLSYLTGLDVETEQPMKYFKNIFDK